MIIGSCKKAVESLKIQINITVFIDKIKNKNVVDNLKISIRYLRLLAWYKNEWYFHFFKSYK